MNTEMPLFQLCIILLGLTNLANPGLFLLQSGRICVAIPACKLEEHSVNSGEAQLDDCTHSARLAELEHVLGQRTFSGVRFQLSGGGQITHRRVSGVGCWVSEFVSLYRGVMCRVLCFQVRVAGSGVRTDVYSDFSVTRQSRNLAKATGKASDPVFVRKSDSCFRLPV